MKCFQVIFIIDLFQEIRDFKKQHCSRSIWKSRRTCWIFVRKSLNSCICTLYVMLLIEKRSKLRTYIQAVTWSTTNFLEKKEGKSLKKGITNRKYKHFIFCGFIPLTLASISSYSTKYKSDAIQSNTGMVDL